MVYYFFILAMVLPGFFEFFKIDKEFRRLFAFLFAVALILFAGLRYETGPDYGSYRDYWNLMTDQLYFFLEPIYVFIVLTLKQLFNLPYQSSVLFFALTAISLKFITIKRYSPYIFFSLIIYFSTVFINSDFGQIRQGLAASIIWLALPFCLDRKPIPFIITVLLAAGFHYSALIFLFAYFVSSMKVLPYWIMCSCWIVAFAISAVFFKSDLLTNIISMVIPEEYAFKLTVYFDNDSFGQTLGFSLGMTIRFFVLLILFIPFKRHCDDRVFRLLINLYFWGGILFFLFNFNAAFTRLATYFICIDILAIPYAISRYKNKWIQLMLFFLFTALSIYNVYVAISNPEYPFFIPYQNILM